MLKQCDLSKVPRPRPYSPCRRMLMSGESLCSGDCRPCQLVGRRVVLGAGSDILFSENGCLGKAEVGVSQSSSGLAWDVGLVAVDWLGFACWFLKAFGLKLPTIIWKWIIKEISFGLQSFCTKHYFYSNSVCPSQFSTSKIIWWNGLTNHRWDLCIACTMSVIEHFYV